MSLRLDADPQPALDTLHARSLDSVFWLTLQHALGALLFVAIPTALARLLSPEDLGLMEMALAFFGVATLFIELGTGPAIIQRPEIDPTFLSTVFLVNLITGAAFAAMLVAGAGPIGDWLRMDDRLPGTMRAVGLAILPLSAAIVPRNLLARRLQYRRVIAADVAAGGVAMVAAAAAFSRGLDQALAAGVVVYGLTAALVIWTAARWRPSAWPAPSTVGPLLAFSLSVSGARIVENLTLQSDRVLIGRFLGAASLGLFGLARTLVRVPLRFLLNVSEELLLPGLSMLQADRPRARQYYLTTIRFELALLGPVVILAAVFAGELTHLLFGPPWGRAGLLAQLMAFAAWRHVSGHTTSAVLLSQGRADLQFRWTIYALVLSVVYFVAGYPWGLEGVAIATAVLDTAGWAVRHTMANTTLELPRREFVRALAPLWLAHLLFVLALVGLRLAIAGVVVAPGWRLAAAVPIACLVYAAILRTMVPGLLTTIGRGAADAASRGLGRAR